MRAIEILFLSRDDVASLNLGADEVVGAVERALVEHSNGTYEMHPKIGVHPTQTDPGNFIHAMPAYLKGMNACGLKWVGGFSNNYQRDLPSVTGIMVYNDADTGIPLAVMDCSYLTGLRTAAVSAIVARCCARPGSRVLALAGCGFQGRMHLRFLTALVPSIVSVRLRDVRPESAQALADEARSYFGGDITVSGSNEECLQGADIISTCTDGETRVIEEKEWFKAGAFGVGIEGGCAYAAEALHQADKFIVDDIPLAEYFDKIGRDRVTADGQPDPEFPGGLPSIYSTIGDIVAGKKPGRESDRERIIAIPIGMGVCDIALTAVIYARACQNNIGRFLRLM
jgi:ornithine cyclodeaminase/alanine dehydrogenase